MNFPNSIKDKTYLTLIILCYISFSFNPEFDFTFDFNLFKNDLNDVLVVNWLFSQLIAEIFIFLLSWQACGITSNRLLKSIFYAVMLDSMITALLAILFGYQSSIYLSLIRNSFTCLAMLYAYYILHSKR